MSSLAFISRVRAIPHMRTVATARAVLSAGKMTHGVSHTMEAQQMSNSLLASRGSSTAAETHKSTTTFTTPLSSAARFNSNNNHFNNTIKFNRFHNFSQQHQQRPQVSIGLHRQLAQRIDVQQIVCSNTVRHYTSQQQQNKEELTKEQQEQEQKQIREKVRMEILNPPTLGERATGAWNKTKSFVVSIPSKTTDLSVRLMKGLMNKAQEFIRNPLVVRDWYRSISHATKEVIHHYWVGSKLLVADIRVAIRILRKMSKGNVLTRRERKQLLKTSADVFRLVPMAVFVIVPFMEFLLPVALKVFPNLLPSTFEDKLKKEEQMKKQLKARIELAKFLQDTVEEMADEMRHSKSSEIQKSAAELKEFIDAVRSGKPVSNDDLIRFAKVFSDELTLDNLSRPQLVAMCKYMGLSTFGGDAFLRFQLRNKLRQLLADDRLIYWEGVNSLSFDELVAACKDRGMRYIGLDKDHLRKQLSQWIELSLNKNVPSTLLILSRAFTITERNAEPEKVIKSTLSILPDEIISQVVPAEEYLKRLEDVHLQERLIEEEEKEMEERRKASAPKELSAEEKERLDETLHKISLAVTLMAKPSSVSKEREELESLMKELHDHVKETEELGQQKGMDRLEKRIQKLIHQIGADIQNTEQTIGGKLNILDKDRDGFLSEQEIKAAIQFLREKPDDILLNKVMEQFDTDRDGKISVSELEDYLLSKQRESKLDMEDVDVLRKEEQEERQRQQHQQTPTPMI